VKTYHHLAARAICQIRTAAMDRCDMVYRDIARSHTERDFGMRHQIQRFDQLHAEAHHA